MRITTEIRSNNEKEKALETMKKKRGSFALRQKIKWGCNNNKGKEDQVGENR